MKRLSLSLASRMMRAHARVPDPRGTWLAGRAKCPICLYRWVAVVPAMTAARIERGRAGLVCPNCSFAEARLTEEE